LIADLFSLSRHAAAVFAFAAALPQQAYALKCERAGACHYYSRCERCRFSRQRRILPDAAFSIAYH